MQFEHRDLHWGNILIEKIEDKNKNLYILVDDAEYEISSCGLVVTIIDFTLARLLSGMILSVHSVIIRLYQKKILPLDFLRHPNDIFSYVWYLSLGYPLNLLKIFLEKPILLSTSSELLATTWQIACLCFYYITSFIISEDCVVYTDLSQEEVLFEGEGDEQFDIYRKMKKHNK